MASSAELNNWFSYHSPSPEQIEKYTAIRAKGKEFAELLQELCPKGADREEAIQAVREVVRLANTSIACDTPAALNG